MSTSARVRRGKINHKTAVAEREHRQEMLHADLRAQGSKHVLPVFDDSTTAAAAVAMSKTPSELGQQDVAASIVERAATVQAEQLGLTPLPEKMGNAAANGNLTAVLKYARKGGDVNARWTTRMNRTMLHEAAMNDNVQLVSALLELRADPDLQSVLGMTPLMLAAAQGSISLASQLLTGGASTAIATHDGQSAMSIALRGGHLEFVKLLEAEQHGPTTLQLTGSKSAARLKPQVAAPQGLTMRVPATTPAVQEQLRLPDGEDAPLTPRVRARGMLTTFASSADVFRGAMAIVISAVAVWFLTEYMYT